MGEGGKERQRGGEGLGGGGEGGRTRHAEEVRLREALTEIDTAEGKEGKEGGEGWAGGGKQKLSVLKTIFGVILGVLSLQFSILLSVWRVFFISSSLSCSPHGQYLRRSLESSKYTQNSSLTPPSSSPPPLRLNARAFAASARDDNGRRGGAWPRSRTASARTVLGVLAEPRPD